MTFIEDFYQVKKSFLSRGDITELCYFLTSFDLNRATVDATVERLLAAGGKRKDDLRASRSERAFEEMKGMTFSPSINENSVKIATRQKERERERLKEDGGEESPMDSSTSSTTSSMSRIQVRSTSAQRRSTFSGRAADSGIYRRSSECDIPYV